MREENRPKSKVELSKYKERVELLSREAKKTYETLQGLCNEILFTQDLNSIEKTPPDIDDISEILLHQVSKKVIEHLNHTQSLLIAFEEYSEMLEKSFSPANLRGKEDDFPDTLTTNPGIRRGTHDKDRKYDR